MELEDSKAWALLKDEEKTAIQLAHVHSKSTWQAGEIMQKSHYKYLEIVSRGEKFLRMFTEHYDMYGELIPESLELHYDFSLYLINCIEKRKTIKGSIKNLIDPEFIGSRDRNKKIIENMKLLEEIGNDESINLLHLVLEFDRWNNFRILPLPIQEPSAFKRRNKNRSLKHIKNMISLSKFAMGKIIDDLYDESEKDSLYACFIDPNDHNKGIVIPIMRKGAEKITTIGIYIFNSHKASTEFNNLILNYINIEKRTCKQGQIFWPLFRQITSEAFNYKDIEKISHSRKYLEYANKDSDKKVIRKYRKFLNES